MFTIILAYLIIGIFWYFIVDNACTTFRYYYHIEKQKYPLYLILFIFIISFIIAVFTWPIAVCLYIIERVINMKGENNVRS